MKFRFGSMFLIALIGLVALVGCELGRDVMMDMMPVTDADTEDVMMPSTDADMDTGAPDMEAASVKLVWLINYPTGGKDAYIAWVASVAPTLQAPEEVRRISSYDNARGANPHRLVEFEFDSFADASTYLNRPDIAAVFEALPNHSSDASTHVYVQRSDYSKNEDASRAVKLVYLVDYPLGGKAAYLEWVASVAPSLQAPDEVKRISSYDNYYGVSPHRWVEFEFNSIEEAHTYLEREEIEAANLELPNRAGSADLLVFEQRSDYANE